MPPLAKYSKESVIEAAFKIVKEEGIAQLNARRIAKELNCSVQPIFSNFENMDDLKKHLYQKIINEFYDFVTKKIDDKIPPYKQIGINYVYFAKKEPILFNILFMNENGLIENDFVNIEDKFSIIKKIIVKTTSISADETKDFHIKMWLFVHGIASIVATNTNFFTDKQISDLLSSQFQALMLLEENPNNKWKISE